MTRIFGIDFTSAPRKAKPIICVESRLEGDRLNVVDIKSWTEFSSFEDFLASDGPWVAGMDFPFSQPATFISRVGFGPNWDDYVEQISNMTKQEFTSLLERDSKAAEPGSKHLFRDTDRLASACSPMMIYGVPVAKMFYEGATRLRNSEISVLPCRPTNDNRFALETYPALVARQFIGRTKYKSGSKRNGAEERVSARRKLSNSLVGKLAENTFGFRVQTSRDQNKMLVADDSGDVIDAVSCCVLAAWASAQKDLGIPCDGAEEGWIIGADHVTDQNKVF